MNKNIQIQNQAPNNTRCIPREGERSFSESLDFSVASTYIIDFIYAVQTKLTSQISSVFVDNSKNAYPITVTPSITNQGLVVPPYSQAYLPMAITGQANISITTQGTLIIPVQFFNYYIEPCIWNVGTNSGATQNVDIVASITLPVNVTNTVTVGGSVAVSNFPATQNVDVLNFPATQNVDVLNFPATQPVSGSVATINYQDSVNQKAFVLAFAPAPSPSYNTYVYITNPTGNSKNIIIDTITVRYGTTDNLVIVQSQYTLGNSSAPNKYLGGPSSSASTNTSNLSPGPPTLISYLEVVQISASTTYEFNPSIPIVVPPGTTFCIFTGAAGTVISGWIDFREI